jgi:hypothetical protein
MTGTDGNNTATRNDGIERRTNLHWRDLFEYAYRIACPLPESGLALCNAEPAHFPRAVLPDCFPEPYPQDITILSVPVGRVFSERSGKWSRQTRSPGCPSIIRRAPPCHGRPRSWNGFSLRD